MRRFVMVCAALAAIFLTSCMSLSPSEEARLSALETANAQGTITPVERDELNELRTKALEGGFDWNRLLELLATFGASVFATNAYRNRQREKRGEPTGVTKG